MFGLSFLDGYSWLRTSPEVTGGLRILGLVMLVTSGLWSAFETNLPRLLGQSVIAENGLVLLATSLAVSSGNDLIFPFFVPRGLAIAVWALALAILHRDFSKPTCG